MTDYNVRIRNEDGVVISECVLKILVVEDDVWKKSRLHRGESIDILWVNS